MRAPEAPRTADAAFARIETLAATLSAENVLGLIQFFAHPIWQARKRASDAIVAFGDKAVPVISQALFLDAAITDDQVYWCIRTAGGIGGSAVNQLLLPLLDHPRLPKNFRVFVLRALADRPDAVVIDKLIAALGDPSWTVRREAADILKGMGEAVSGPIKAAFVTGNEDVRYWAVKVLGHVMGREAVEYFRAMLKAPKKETRYYAVAALGEIDSDEALQALTPLFSDESWLVRAQVAEIFEKRGRKSIPFLKRVFESGTSDARFQTIRLMGKIMGREAKGFIEKILRSKETEMKFYALSALAETSDPDAPMMVANAFQDEVWLVRKHAAETLAKMGSRALPLLQKFLAESRDENVRHWAITSLCALGQAGTPELLTAWDGFDKKEKKGVLASLREAADPASLELLFKALGDREWPVRSEAAAALEARVGECGPRLVPAFLSDNRDVRFWVMKLASSRPAEVAPALRAALAVPEIPSVEQLRSRAAATLLLLAGGGVSAHEALDDIFSGGEEERDYVVSVLRDCPVVPALFETLAEAWCEGDENRRALLAPFVRSEFLKHADAVRQRIAENPNLWLPILELAGAPGSADAQRFLQGLLSVNNRDVRAAAVTRLVSAGTIEGIAAVMAHYRAADEEGKIAVLSVEAPGLSKTQVKAMTDAFRTLSDTEALWIAKLLAEWCADLSTQLSALLAGSRDPKIKEWLRRVLDHLEGKVYL